MIHQLLRGNENTSTNKDKIDGTIPAFRIVSLLHKQPLLQHRDNIGSELTTTYKMIPQRERARKYRKKLVKLQERKHDHT